MRLEPVAAQPIIQIDVRPCDIKLLNTCVTYIAALPLAHSKYK